MTELNSSLCQLNWLLAKHAKDPEPVALPDKEEKEREKEKEQSASPDPFAKPPFSYSQLIRQAIESSEGKKCTLASIYRYVASTYPYYGENRNPSWRNSIRHNLSLNKLFVKCERRENDAGKGSYWQVVEGDIPKRLKGVESARINPAVERKFMHIIRVDSKDSDTSSVCLPSDVRPAPADSAHSSNPASTDSAPLASPASPPEEEEEEDLSGLYLFESHNLNASFRTVYDSIFSKHQRTDKRQQEAQIDWLRISLETAGLDYHNNEEMDNVDTERFIEFMNTECGSLYNKTQTVVTANPTLSQLNRHPSLPMSTNNNQDEEEIEDDFDWNTLIN